MQDQSTSTLDRPYITENIPLLLRRLQTSMGMIQASLTLLGEVAKSLEASSKTLEGFQNQFTIPPPESFLMQPMDVSFTKASLEQSGTTQPTTKPRNGRRARRDRHSASTLETSTRQDAKDARTKARSTKVKSSRHSSWDAYEAKESKKWETNLKAQAKRLRQKRIASDRAWTEELLGISKK